MDGLRHQAGTTPDVFCGPFVLWLDAGINCRLESAWNGGLRRGELGPDVTWEWTKDKTGQDRNGWIVVWYGQQANISLAVLG